MKLSLFFVSFLLMVINTQETYTLSYCGYERMSGKRNPSKMKVYLDIPNEPIRIYESNELNFGETSISAVYMDSSEIFISNSFYDGTSKNFQNRIYSKQYRSGGKDTLDSSGFQENGLLWREIILGKLVIGYRNVPVDRKLLFDKSLSTVRKRKKMRPK